MRELGVPTAYVSVQGLNSGVLSQEYQYFACLGGGGYGWPQMILLEE